MNITAIILLSMIFLTGCQAPKVDQPEEGESKRHKTGSISIEANEAGGKIMYYFTDGTSVLALIIVDKSLGFKVSMLEHGEVASVLFCDSVTGQIKRSVVWPVMSDVAEGKEAMDIRGNVLLMNDISNVHVFKMDGEVRAAVDRDHRTMGESVLKHIND